MTPRTPVQGASLATIVAGLAAVTLIPTTASAGLIGAPQPTCHGMRATVRASSGVVNGTPGRDVISLTGPAVVHAGAGDDVICGSRGADEVNAGPGDDVVLGRRGSDRLQGGPGSDHLYGEKGADVLAGGPGRDVLMGGSGRDRFIRGDLPVRGTGDGGWEQQVSLSGDTVLQGSRGVSLLVDNASALHMIETGAGFTTHWAAMSSMGIAGLPVLGAVMTFPRPINDISFPGTAGVYATSSLVTAFPGEVIDNQGMMTTPIGSTLLWTGSQLVPEGPWPVPAGTSAQLQNTLSTQIVGGTTVGVVVNRRSLGQMPVTAMEVPPWAYMTFPVANSLVIAATPLAVTAQPWTIQPAVAPEPSTTVDFSGPDEVVDVAYSTSGGFIQ